MMRKLGTVLLLMALSTPVVADVAVPPKKKDGGRPIVDAPAHSWWTDQEAGWLGGLVGGTVGMLGGVVGTLGGLGLARRFVLTLAGAMLAAGILLVIGGIVAVALGQPYHVYFFMLLIGAVMTFCMGLNYPMLKRRYEQRELQQISALDS